MFWHWIDIKTIGMVTGTAVYHWSVEGESPPNKIFDRNANLSGCQIINYRVNSDGKWMVLIGISSQVRIYLHMHTYIYVLYIKSFGKSWF